MELRDSSYELCYNAACQYAARGELSNAERLLVRAQGKTLLDEDGGDGLAKNTGEVDCSELC